MPRALPIGAVERTNTSRIRNLTHLHEVNSGSLRVEGIRKPYISIESLMLTGKHDFQLTNGAIGRFVYLERRVENSPEGFYLGFALKKLDCDEYVIYGRVAFDYVPGKLGGLHLSAGYETVRTGKPDYETSALAEDIETPIFVSTGIKEGYSGIGTVLMQLAAGIGKSIKASRVEILQSISTKSDRFYESLGYSRPRKEIADYQLQLENHVFPSDVAISPKDTLVNAVWRPIEEEQNVFEWQIATKRPWWLKIAKLFGVQEKPLFSA